MKRFGLNWRHLSLPALVAAGCCSSAIEAAERGFVGPQAIGRGGTGVATPHDIFAQYYNPAGFGFMSRGQDAADLPPPDADVPVVEGVDNTGLGDKSWGANLFDFQAGVNFVGDLSEILSVIEDIDTDALSDATNLNADQAEDVVQVASLLNALDGDTMGFGVDFNAGLLGLQIGNFAIGTRLYVDAAFLISDIDLENLGLETPDELLDGLDGNAAEIIGSAPAGYTIQTLTTDQQNTLAADGFSADAIAAIDFVASDLVADGLLTSDQIDGVVGTLNQALSGDGSLDDNTTAVLVSGLAVAEIPISYGYAFDDHLSIGVNVKIMFGQTFGAEVLVFDDPDLEEVEESISEDTEESINWGIDLAAMYRLNNFQFGVIGRNLNQPSFDGFVLEETGTVVEDREVDPTMTVGMAWVPTSTVVVEVNADLWEHSSLLGFRDIQNVGIGVEWDILKFLALRIGAYDNIAEAEEEPTITAGLGLNLWLMRLDLAGAVGTETVTYDGEDIPTSARFSLGLQMDF